MLFYYGLEILGFCFEETQMLFIKYYLRNKIQSNQIYCIQLGSR